MPLSNESLICRVEWRPSWWLCAALVGLGGLAAQSLWLSALPVAIKALLGLVALIDGVCLARREARRESSELVWRGGNNEVSMNFVGRMQSWSNPCVHFRGPLVSLSGVDEHKHTRRLHWWPDTLSGAGRRSLRLAMSVRNRTSSLK